MVASDIGVRINEGNPFSVWTKMQFGLTLQTPITWVQYLSSRAAFDGRPMNVGDISEDDRTQYLRVFVRPAFLIRQVALITPDGGQPLQAKTVRPCRHFISFSAFGMDGMDRNCTEYLFDWPGVLSRTDNGQREFDLAVTAITQTAGLTGATREVRKSYRIKRSQLNRLVWKTNGGS